MTGIVELLGPTVEGEGGKSVDTQSFIGEGKYVGLYFSAHWCPPCRGFTPVLSTFYKDFRKKEEGKGKLEIVFVSSDQTEEEFKNYFAEMPWLVLPFAERAKKEELGKRFGVRGIPTLIILDSTTGAIVTKQGRQAVVADPEGKEFPWEN